MKLFHTGIEQANLVIQSNVLPSTWREISKLQSSSSSSKLGHSVSSEDSEWTVISFTTSETLQQGSDLVSSTVKGKSFELFAFLRLKKRFAINEASINLFHEHRDQLSQLKDQVITSTKPLIIVGHGFGGSIASLFTLWLLESGDFTDKKRPICVTFGSPLIGDTNLQQALYKYTPWSSNFLHVVSVHDPVPRMFANTEKSYKPFGTFLLCSNSGSSCFDEPETVLKLLDKTDPSQNRDAIPKVDYSEVVQDLRAKVVFKRSFDLNWDAISSTYQVGTVTQLSAIGLPWNSQPENEIVALTEEMEKREMKFLIGKRRVNRDKKLNEAKMNLAKIEWYIKFCRDQGIGYYDSYKNMRFMRDLNIQECVKRLIIYWSDLVHEADMKPQSELETLRTRWLRSGLNYMRIVEPLCIAEHYGLKGLSRYEDTGRLKHFRRLEELVAEADRKKVTNAANKDIKTTATMKKKMIRADDKETKKRAIEATVTEDPCFWAKVEEAIISCRAMERAEATEKKKSERELGEFARDLLRLLKESAVSPDIFLEGSSFMLWWKEYKSVLGNSCNSTLNNIMVNDKYKNYCLGEELKFAI